MLIFVYGGSGSGKSAFAESLLTRRSEGHRAYIATMEPYGEEGARRIARHRALRAGKGFTTYECQRGLETLALPEGSAALLEDLTNLFANEWFGGERAGAADRVLAGLDRLGERCSLAVVVGNDVFADGVGYDEETEAYLRALAGVNRAAAARAHEIWEVVCGLPLRQAPDYRPR